MNRKTKMYTVRGSEDGILGIFSSYKKALERCIEYCTTEGEAEPIIDRMKYSTIVEGKYGDAEILWFHINEW